ncbi:hypothetical protein LRE75_21240 [Streptomyces sp. 372A]
MSMPGMSLQASRIPDGTKPEVHDAAYKNAKANNAIFVCVVRQGRRWTLKIDAFTSRGPTIPERSVALLRSAAEELVLAGTVTQANVAPDYISMGTIESEREAREIAAAFHAALSGLQQLHIAVPSSGLPETKACE